MGENWPAKVMTFTSYRNTGSQDDEKWKSEQKPGNILSLITNTVISLESWTCCPASKWRRRSKKTDTDIQYTNVMDRCRPYDAISCVDFVLADSFDWLICLSPLSQLLSFDLHSQVTNKISGFYLERQHRPSLQKLSSSPFPDSICIVAPARSNVDENVWRRGMYVFHITVKLMLNFRGMHLNIPVQTSKTSHQATCEFFSSPANIILSRHVNLWYERRLKLSRNFLRPRSDVC